MAITWQDASEIVAGQLWEGKLATSAVRSSLLFPPYNEIAEKLDKGDSKEDIILTVGITPIQASIDAIESLNGLGSANWLQILEKTAMEYDAGMKLEKLGKKLQRGDEVNWADVNFIAEKAQSRTGGMFIPLSDIEGMEIPLKKTGFAAIDTHLGGFPEIGQVVVAAPPGCLSGDTIIACNRARKGFSIKLKNLFYMQNGGKSGGKYWRKDIDTYLQSKFSDETIRLNKLKLVYQTGLKDTYKLLLENGMSLVGTFEHPILTDIGWIELGNLTSDNYVYVNSGKSDNGNTKISYSQKEGLYFHPFCGRRKQKRYSVSYHRLVFEANLNGISVEEFVTRCRTGRNLDDLQFISSEYVIHHKDRNPKNNNIDNLELMSKKEHHKLHAEDTYKNVLDKSTLVKVVSVEYSGKEMTYDISMDDEPFNFLANGIVVHNTGKTTFLTALASCWVKEHKDEKVAIFTLEMMAKEIKMRFSETSNLSQEEQSRILVNDDILTPEEVISYASTIKNLGLVCIDFADLLISGETTESAMAHIYRTFMLGAKKLGCTVVLLSQLNRNYNGGIPRPNNIRYTGLAEALAWMILMLYNPTQDYFAEDEGNLLPAISGRAYIIAWKIRGGFRMHKADSPGAIQLHFKGELGWRVDHPGRWFSLQKA